VQLLAFLQKAMVELRSEACHIEDNNLRKGKKHASVKDVTRAFFVGRAHH